MDGIRFAVDEGNIMFRSVQLAASTVDASTLTTDRAVASAAALVALAAAIIGGLALARPARGGTRRPLIAVGAGILGTLAGVWVLATADGGPGTGNGVVGGYAGVAFGLLAAALGGLALARSRRRA
ncbi:hypothetical protein BC793_106400 [Actinoplanes xinjiangensis]|uniref:Uncharacterized protein n=2 Tax=Actinoplanes xinjiangensis TaxID=512350 RepID=A0A316FKQ6_9ACTN|nr:hypothetical protein BC793_106400 [Actinoplanes xinjiangensis]